MTSHYPCVSLCLLVSVKSVKSFLQVFHTFQTLAIQFHSNLVAFFLFLSASLPDGSYAKVSKLINRKLKNYDKNVRPNDTGRKTFFLVMVAYVFFFFLLVLFFVLFCFLFFLSGRPVEVLIEFKLMSFGKIREEDMVSCLSLVNMGMRQKWAR